MPDLYARISEVPQDIQERLAGVLEARAADEQQKEMLKSYLSEIDFPIDARVLEIGCRPGAVTRTLATWPRVSRAVGIDPSATFIAKICVPRARSPGAFHTPRAVSPRQSRRRS